MGRHVRSYSPIRFFLQLPTSFLLCAERKDLEQCTRILAVQCAHYRSKFCEIPMAETMEVLNSETLNDDQANWIGYGFETLLGILGMLEQEHPKHSMIIIAPC